MKQSSKKPNNSNKEVKPNKDKTNQKNQKNNSKEVNDNKTLNVKEAIADIEENSFEIEEEQSEDNTKNVVNNELYDKSDESEISQNDYEEESVDEKNNKSKRVKKIKNTIEGFGLNTGVIYVSHLPWGINERNLKKYFEQFGKITRYILPRAKSSGRIKGYAFIEFENIEIADIASKTMNNFILFNKIIKCETLADRSRYNSIFKRWKKQFKYFNRYKAFVVKRNKIKSFPEIKDQVKLILEKEEKKRQKLKDLNIDYDFPGFKACLKN